jgi:hypothetical protein
MIVNVDRFAVEDCLCEFEVRHVGSSERPVYGEKAQAGRRDAVEMRIGIGKQLVAFFRRCIQRNRMVHPVADGKRRLFAVAVDRRAGSIQQVFDGIAAHRLQNVEKPDDVLSIYAREWSML